MVPVLDELEEYALLHNIPIMEKESLDFIKMRIKLFKIQKILEIGAAIGYSAINYALTDTNIEVTTIEKDRDRFLEATKNVSKYKLTNQIQIIFADAMETTLTDKYDLIVIDASKAKNKDFFERFKSLLNSSGLIIIDNIKFHGLVGKSNEIESKNLRNMVKKIEEFKEFLNNNKEFRVEYIDVGDGLAVCYRTIKRL